MKSIKSGMGWAPAPEFAVDKGFAAGGAFIPYISGSAILKLIVKATDKIKEVLDMAEDQDKENSEEYNSSSAPSQNSDESQTNNNSKSTESSTAISDRDCIENENCNS